MAQVAPSILSADFANLAADCRRVVSPRNKLLHFDVMDGNFVPNITVGAPVLQSLKKALPQAEYDVHLMVMRPRQFVKDFAQAGAGRITFHIEADSPVKQTIEEIRAAGCQPGLSLRPGTSLERLFPWLPAISQVLVMSVEPGFGGQAFQPAALQRIAALRREAERQNTPLVIEVDGGINPETAPACVAAGADILVAGNAIFNAANPAAALQQLLDIPPQTER